MVDIINNATALYTIGSGLGVTGLVSWVEPKYYWTRVLSQVWAKVRAGRITVMQFVMMWVAEYVFIGLGSKP